MSDELRRTIDRLYEEGPAADRAAARDAFVQVRDLLSAGRVRAAEPDVSSPTGWRVHAWVKRAILLGFRHGAIVDMSVGSLSFADKDTLPLRAIDPQAGVRVPPGGSSVREGAYLGQRVVCMPPMYVNIGAYVDDDSMIDSHALVGKRVHVSAAAQIGGVLEPVGALPVIIEDDVLVGGNCGVYEGAIVRRRAVLGSGTILTGSTPLFDLVRGEIIRGHGECPVVVPEGAVVVPGSRAVPAGYGRQMNLSVYTPVIVKYRDEKTDLSTTLEDLLR